ncbi:hypothetical protein Tco_0122516 [Tanacetum coccineum]
MENSPAPQSQQASTQMPPFLLAMVRKCYTNLRMWCEINLREKAMFWSILLIVSYDPMRWKRARTIGADGQVFIFDNDAVRLDFTKFVNSTSASFQPLRQRQAYEIIKKRPTNHVININYNERRSSTNPESVEVCVCLKDYLDGVDRVQHETSLEGPILEDVEETIAREEVELGISPPNTELDEGEFEDLDIEHVNVEDFLEDLMD